MLEKISDTRNKIKKTKFLDQKRYKCDKNKRKALILIILFLFIYVVSSYILKKIDYKDSNLLYLKSNTNINYDSIMNLKKYNIKDFTYQRNDILEVEFISNKFKANVISTNPNNSYIRKLNILNGRFFLKDEFYDKKYLCVVNKNLAYKFFGSLDILGTNIKINNYEFKIIGVSSSILNKEYENEDYYVYIPYSLSNQILDDNNIDNMLILNDKESSITNKANEILNYLKLDSNDISYFNIGFYIKMMNLKIKIFIFLFLIASFMCFYKELKSKLDIIRKKFTYFNENYYFKDLIKLNKLKVFKVLIKIVGLIFILASLLYLFRHSLRFDIFYDKEFSIMEFGFSNFKLSGIFMDDKFISNLISYHKIINICFIILISIYIYLIYLCKKIQRCR
ncbi:ABC transporter permease [Peptostreptococcaceae bacterium AGR-M142]